MTGQIEYTVKVLDEGDVPAEIDMAIRQILSGCFPHRRDEFGRCRWLNGNVPDFTVIAEYGEKVVGHAAAVERIISVDGRLIRCCGVANVGVEAGHRGRGVSDMMLKELIGQARRRGYGVGLLFCQDHVKNIYLRNGWADQPGVEVEYLEGGERVFIGADRHKMFHWLKISGLGKVGKVELNGARW